MKDTALLIIDAQVGLLDESRRAHRGGAVVSNIKSLISKARAAGVPVVYVQHDGGGDSPVAVGSEGWPIHPDISPAPGDPLFRKRASDSFHETALAREFEARGVRRLFVAGCRTEYCVDTTCRRAISLGYDVTLVTDAHTTVDNGLLTAAQIIEHHNRTLDDFGTDEHVITVCDSGAVSFD